MLFISLPLNWVLVSGAVHELQGLWMTGAKHLVRVKARCLYESLDCGRRRLCWSERTSVANLVDTSPTAASMLRIRSFSSKLSTGAPDDSMGKPSGDIAARSSSTKFSCKCKTSFALRVNRLTSRSVKRYRAEGLDFV